MPAARYLSRWGTRAPSPPSRRRGCRTEAAWAAPNALYRSRAPAAHARRRRRSQGSAPSFPRCRPGPGPGRRVVPARPPRAQPAGPTARRPAPPRRVVWVDSSAASFRGSCWNTGFLGPAGDAADRRHSSRAGRGVLLPPQAEILRPGRRQIATGSNMPGRRFPTPCGRFLMMGSAAASPRPARGGVPVNLCRCGARGCRAGRFPSAGRRTEVRAGGRPP